MGTVMSMTVVGVRGSRIVQAHDPGITEVRLAIEDGTPTWPLNIFYIFLDDGWHVVSMTRFCTGLNTVTMEKFRN